MRFLRSTATFRADAFTETSPMAIAACTQPDSIQNEAALILKDPSLSATGPPQSLLGARQRDGIGAAAGADAALCVMTEEARSEASVRRTYRVMTDYTSALSPSLPAYSLTSS